jgi:hypothetical protein
MAANKMKQIFNSDNHHNTLTKSKLYTIKKLNHKLVTENAILVQANKGKTTVLPPIPCETGRT